MQTGAPSPLKESMQIAEKREEIVTVIPRATETNREK
jgi:hypothetical protein